MNAGGVYTRSSCCGHRKMPGRIDLGDGRVLVVLEDAKQVDRAGQVVWQTEEQLSHPLT